MANTLTGWTRVSLALFLPVALEGCAPLPVIAGGPPEAPSFMVMRDEPVLTSFTVACGSGRDWETQWKINGETTAKVIDYGVAPKGMTTIVAAAPIRPQGQICRAEVQLKGKSGKTFVRKSLWVLDPAVESCRSEKSCIAIIVSGITDATPHIPRAVTPEMPVLDVLSVTPVPAHQNGRYFISRPGSRYSMLRSISCASRFASPRSCDPKVAVNSSTAV